MANLPELTTDCEGTNNANVTSVNSIFTNTTGGTAPATAAVFSTTWEKEGSSSIRVDVATQTSILRVDPADLTTLWMDMYIRVDRAPGPDATGTEGESVSIITLIDQVGAGAADDVTIGGVQVTAVNASTSQYKLKLRSGFAQVGLTPAMNIGEVYRIAFKCRPGFTGTGDANGLVLKVFSGANLDTMSPTHNLNAASTVANPINSVRIGALNTEPNGIGILYYFDDLISDDTTQPARSAPTTDIPEWEENFEGAAVGTNVFQTPSVSKVTAISVGSENPILFFADPYSNTKCARVNNTALWSSYRMTKSAESGEVFFKFALKVQTVPDVTTAILAAYNGTTKLMDLRVVRVDASNYNLQIRDNSTSQWTSGNISAGAYIEVALWLSPNEISPGVGRMSLRYYAGFNRGQTATTTGNSGAAENMIISAQTAITEIRFGGFTAFTGDIRFDTFRADRVSEPAGIAPPASTLEVTSPNLTNVEPYANFNLTASVTGGTLPYTYSWAQIAGSPSTGLTNATSATATGIGPAVAAGTTLTYRITVTDGAAANDTADVTVAVLPHTEFSRNAANNAWEAIRRWNYNNLSNWE